MIPDISLDECIMMLDMLRDTAHNKYIQTGNFEYILCAHKYSQISKHLKEYQRLVSQHLDERLIDVLREVRDERDDRTD